MKLRPSYLAQVFIAITVILILLSVSQATRPGQESTDPYWTPVEKAIGKSGTLLPGGVFRIDMTRSSPSVAIGNARLKPAMAMDSWISFIRMGNGTMMMGDLVLTAEEMGPVQARLSAEGIDITAVHNTLIGESPQVYDLHIGGQGNPAVLAAKVRSALDAAGIAIGNESHAAMEPGLPYGQLDTIMGYNGTKEGGVYLYAIPRAERITMGGMEIPPSMDVATTVKFQPLGNGTAAVTGDLLLRPDEVKPVIRILNENGIEVTALHTHMLTEEPPLFMMHFWATGDADRMARALRLALDKTNSVKPH